MKLNLSNGSCSRGAQMGRLDIVTSHARTQKLVKLHLERLKWVDGDYDQWGAYWGGGRGRGDNIYCAWGHDEPGEQVQIFVRARSRTDAKRAVVEKLPMVKFFR